MTKLERLCAAEKPDKISKKIITDEKPDQALALAALGLGLLLKINLFKVDP
jgi:hypothetical protein